MKEGEVPFRENGETTMPWLYRIIYNTDRDLTLQAIVASMIYDELILQDAEDETDRIHVNVDGTEEIFHKRSVYSLFESLKMSNRDKKEVIERKNQEQLGNLRWHIKSHDKYKTIDERCFNESIDLDLKSDDELTPIRVGPHRLSQVYLLPFDELSRCFKNLQNLPDKVVLKLYDFDVLETCLKLHIEDLKMYSLNDTFNIDDMYDYATKLFLNEIACYNKIYSSEESIRVPDLYDYGVMTRVVNGTPISSGFFLLMSYIESNEEDQKLLEMAQNAKSSDGDGISIKDLENHVKPDVMEDLLDQIKLLENIGVEHGDLYLRNLIPSNGKFTIIDFSHGDIKV